MTFRALAIAALAATPLLLACQGDSSDVVADSCAGAKCDSLEGDTEPLESPCADALFDRSGRGFLPERLADDALVKFVYMDAADGCPVTPAEIMKVLSEKDNSDCGSNDGLATMVVSETAQLAGSSDGASYRAITARTCGDRPDFGLLFSMFGFADGAGEVSPDGDGFPDGVEVIAFDESNGVFNYYKEVGGKMGFFGSSTDFVSQGPGGPNLTSERGCANCHAGGGLVMKELTAPWLHWEGDFESPGAQELVSNRKDVMGKREDGPHPQFEIIQPGNEQWNKRRVDFLKDEGSVAQLLEPLFCPIDVNIAAFNSKSRVQDRFLFDRAITPRVGAGSSRIALTESHYNRITGALGQRVAGSDKSDVVAPMAFIERSHIDNHYVQTLVDKGIVDDEFVIDVLMVDFTRPVFSDDRCDLLGFAPTLAAEERSPDAIRDGFLDKLDGAADGTAAAQLREHLLAHKEGQRFDHKATVDSFVATCKERQANDRVPISGSSTSAFHRDVLKLRSLSRKIAFSDGVVDSIAGSAAHAFKVFEFGNTMPTDDLEVVASADAEDLDRIHPQARLSPTTCTLVSSFETAGTRPDSGGGDQPGSLCPGECGEFVNEASCQCDDQCTEFGNCCEQFELSCNKDPSLTCASRGCDDFVDEAECQCDPDCTQFGNCCDDFELLCSEG